MLLGRACRYRKNITDIFLSRYCFQSQEKLKQELNEIVHPSRKRLQRFAKEFPVLAKDILTVLSDEKFEHEFKNERKLKAVRLVRTFLKQSDKDCV